MAKSKPRKPKANKPPGNPAGVSKPKTKRNPGKIFEADFQASAPPDVWVYRLKDGSASWGRSEATRFQTHNIADFLIHDDRSGELLIMELKSIAGTSLPFADIRLNNLADMVDAENYHARLRSIMIINYRKHAKTIAIPAALVMDFIVAGTRKSIPESWAIENGTEIPATVKKVHYTYDINVIRKPS